MGGCWSLGRSCRGRLSEQQRAAAEEQAQSRYLEFAISELDRIGMRSAVLVSPRPRPAPDFRSRAPLCFPVIRVMCTVIRSLSALARVRVFLALSCDRSLCWV